MNGSTTRARPLARVSAILTALALATGAACAADIYAPAPASAWAPATGLADPGDRWEARFGVFAHGVGSAEENTVDLNGEIATPRLPLGVTGFWRFLVPRVHVGGFANLSGRTSVLYTGFLWTLPLSERFFVEGFIGPAIHNGSLVPTATHAGLGCHTLFNAGGSIGYRFDQHWSVQATFDHLSNGRELFGINCGTNQVVGGNQGLNNYGIRLGYAF
jgi:hypothetical protein